MSRTGADVAELTQLRIELTRWRRQVTDAVGDAADAVERFERRATEFVPPLPRHRESVAAASARVASMGDDVGRTRDALRAADRWVGATVARTAFELELDRQSVVAAPAGAAWFWQAFRTATLGGWRTPATTGWLTGLVDDVGRAVGRLSPTVTQVSSTTGQAGRARAALANTRVAAVVRVGSRGVGVAGAVVAGVGAAQAWREGDTEGAVTGALSAASSLAMVSGVPVLQAAGAVVQGGLLVYEYREQIAGGVSAIGEAALSVARGLF